MNKTWLFVGFIGASQSMAVTLQDAQQLAMRNNPDVKKILLEEDSASWEETRALAEYMPHINAAGRHLFAQKFEEITTAFGGNTIVMPAIQPYTMMSLTASVLVFDGFSAWHKYRAAQLSRMARHLELERAKFRLEEVVRTKFYQAVGAEVLVAVARQNIATLEHHLKDVKAQVRGGVSTRFDILRSEVQLEDARTELLSAEEGLKTARANFWQEVGAPDDGSPFSTPLPANLQNIDLASVAVDLTNRADLKAQSVLEESASRQALAAKRYWVPKVSLFGTREWYNNINHSAFGDDAIFKNSYAVGVSMTWNIFDGGAALADAHLADNRAKIANIDVQDLTDKIKVDFEYWKGRLAYSIANYKAKMIAIKKAEESIRLAKGGVRAGTRTNTEVLDAVLDLNNAKAKAVKSQIEALEALGNVELAIGHRLRGVG